MNRNFQSKYSKFTAGLNRMNGQANPAMMGIPLNIPHVQQQQQQQQQPNTSGYNRMNGNFQQQQQRNCMPSNGTYYYAGPPDNSIGVAADNNAVNMPVLLKNRLLNEETFFLNKSNSKWITIGIVPSYHGLNEQKFSIGIKIGGENGSVSLTENGLSTVMNLFKSIKYFEKYGSPASIEYERGILISSFQMKGTPCYKIVNQLDNSSICLAISGVEELMEMEEYLFEIIERIDVVGIEIEFENILDKIIMDWDDFYENDKSGKLQSQLLINFNDFLMTCVEIRKEAMERENVNDGDANDAADGAANDGNNDDNGANQDEPPKKKPRAPKRKSNQ